MKLESFESFVESCCPDAIQAVDLIKLARNAFKCNIRGELQVSYQRPGVYTPFSLVMDGESCLDRLYGGYFGDWVCGGQWNRMLDYLTTFFDVAMDNLEITVFFNGSLEPERLNNWIEKQCGEKEKILQVIRHIENKGTPPPKVWWIPPQCLHSSLRLLLRYLKVKIVMTTVDHHQEVMSYLHKHNFHGLVADDIEYIMFNPTRYFSSKNVKLSFHKNLYTKEYQLIEIIRSLNIQPYRLCIVAALLGNHILTDLDLASFHMSFNPQLKGKDKSNALVLAIVDYVRDLPCVKDLNLVAEKIFGTKSGAKCLKLKKCVAYYYEGRNQRKGSGKTNASQDKTVTEENMLQGSSMFANENIETSNEHFTYKDCAILSLPNIAPEVISMCQDRYKKGLMHHYIYQVLCQGKIKMPAIFEDMYGEIPQPHLFYRRLRQMVYGILFTQSPCMERDKNRCKEKNAEFKVEELILSNSNIHSKPDNVPIEHLCLPIPTISQLWFTTGQDANNKRLQAFLTCMQSNTSSMFNTQIVPQHFLILCCVLRYMLSNSKQPFLSHHEFDAFLVQAVNSHLMDFEYTNNLEVPKITTRGVMLAALFMDGVDHALMANDACGAPIPWLMCCPWLFFDGKLFHSILLKSQFAKNIRDLCDHMYEDIVMVDQLKTAILEELNVKFLPPRSVFSVGHQTVSMLSENTECQPQSREHQNITSRDEILGTFQNLGPKYRKMPGPSNFSLPSKVLSVNCIGRGQPIQSRTYQSRSKKGIRSDKRCSTKTSPQKSEDFSTLVNKCLPRMGMGRGLIALDDKNSDFTKMGFEL